MAYSGLLHRFLHLMIPGLPDDSPIPKYLANRPVTHQPRNAGRSRQYRFQNHNSPSHGCVLGSHQNPRCVRFVHVALWQTDWQPQRRKTTISVQKVHSQREEFTAQLFRVRKHIFDPLYPLKSSRKERHRVRMRRLLGGRTRHERNHCFQVKDPG